MRNNSINAVTTNGDPYNFYIGPPMDVSIEENDDFHDMDLVRATAQFGGFGFEGVETCEISILLDPVSHRLVSLDYVAINQTNDRVGFVFEGYPYFSNAAFWDPSLMYHTARSIDVDAERQIVANFLNEFGGSISSNSCIISSTVARVINVSEFVNIRRGPSLRDGIVAQANLGERLTLVGTGWWFLDNPRGQQCSRLCEQAPNNPALQPQLRQCIEDAEIWL